MLLYFHSKLMKKIKKRERKQHKELKIRWLQSWQEKGERLLSNFIVIQIALCN